MRKLVIDCLAFEYGKSFGYQEYLLNILDYLYENRDSILFHKIIIVCVNKQTKYFEKYLDKISIQSYHCNSIITRLFIQSFFPFYLHLNNGDLILFTANYSSLVKRCKHVLVIHDLLFKRKRLFPYRLMRIQRAVYIPISVKKADKIIAISNFTKLDILNFYPKSQGKIDTIYNYFNFNKYPLLDFSLKKENQFISVCSSAYHKNTSTMLKAFEEYCIKGGTFDMIMVGSLVQGTPLYEQYQLLDISIKKKILLYNKITNSQLAKLYSKSKAYISTSYFEGLGMPIVEAMYFNLPVILPDLPVFHEVSLELGIFFDLNNFKTLTDQMFIVQNSNLDCNYSGNVLDVFSDQNTSDKYIKLINNFI